MAHHSCLAIPASQLDGIDQPGRATAILFDVTPTPRSGLCLCSMPALTRKPETVLCLHAGAAGLPGPAAVAPNQRQLHSDPQRAAWRLLRRRAGRPEAPQLLQQLQQALHPGACLCCAAVTSQRAFLEWLVYTSVLQLLPLAVRAFSIYDATQQLHPGSDVLQATPCGACLASASYTSTLQTMFARAASEYQT